MEGVQNMQRRSIGAVIGGGMSGLWQRTNTGARSAAVENRFVQAFVAKKWTLLLIVMAFLLGRAMILEQLSPFALAFIAVIYFTRRDILHWVGVAAFAGSLLSLGANTGYLVT